MKWLEPTWWKGITQLAAVEWDGRAVSRARILIMEKKGQRVRSVAYQGFEDWASAMVLLKRHPEAGIVLCIWNSGVLEREVPSAQEADAVQVALGTRDSDEFVAEIISGTNGTSLAAICRVDILDLCLEQLGKMKYRLVDIVLTRWVATQWAAGQTDSKYFQLCLPNPAYGWMEGNYASLDDLGKHRYEVLDLPTLESTAGVQEGHALMAGALLDVWAKADALGKRTGPGEAVWQPYLQLSIMKHAAIVAVLFLGLIYAGLASLRIQGERAEAELSELYTQRLPVLTALGSLDEKIATRKTLKTKLGSESLRQWKATFYLDRVVALASEDIALKQLVFMPREAHLKRYSATGVKLVPHLLLHGSCGESQEIGAYSRALEEQDWVAQVATVRSERNFQSGGYDFTILIELTDV